MRVFNDPALDILYWISIPIVFLLLCYFKLIFEKEYKLEYNRKKNSHNRSPEKVWYIKTTPCKLIGGIVLSCLPIVNIIISGVLLVWLTIYLILALIAAMKCPDNIYIPIDKLMFWRKSKDTETEE